MMSVQLERRAIGKVGRASALGGLLVRCLVISVRLGWVCQCPSLACALQELHEGALLPLAHFSSSLTNVVITYLLGDIFCKHCGRFFEVRRAALAQCLRVCVPGSFVPFENRACCVMSV